MGILSALGIPTNKFELFLRSVEVSSYTSTATGSILIKYTPQLLHTNEELTRAESYIKENAKNRK